MGQVHVSVLKETQFQGRAEQFSNVYRYEIGDVTPEKCEALIAPVVAAERALFGSAVTFRQARVYTTNSGFPITVGQTFAIQDLSGTGSGGGTGYMYKECAVLVQWPLPRRVSVGGGIGRTRRLSKWLHTCAGASLNIAEATGESPLTSAQKAPYVTYAAAVRTVNGHSLVAPDGDVTTAAAEIQPYLEHRQFPPGRKED